MFLGKKGAIRSTLGFMTGNPALCVDIKLSTKKFPVAAPTSAIPASH